MIVVDHAKLTGIAHRVFVATGSAEAEAQIIADHLVEANLKGHDSHGVGMIPTYIRNYMLGRVKPNQHICFDRQDGVLAVIDGQMGYGQVIAREATNWAIETAKTS